MFMFWIYLVINLCSADPLLEELYGVHKGNKVTVCAEGRACDGAVWWRRWVVARDSCLHGANITDIDIRRNNVNCSNVDIDKKNKAVNRYKLPKKDDVALLKLSWPYYEDDPLINQTNGHLLTELEEYVGGLNIPRREAEMYYSYQYVKINTSPIKIFLLTVIVPSAVFVVFFFFIIFFTGSKKSRASYRPLLHEIDN